MRRRVPALLVVAALLLVGAAPPNDPLAPEQWHLPKVGAFEAWDASRGGGVVVAVVDTGVNRHHPDLGGRVTGGIDLVDPGTPPDDPAGHGTLVAGIVAASSGNGIGGAGLAPEATIMPVRVLDEHGSGTASNVAAGIRWASEQGADVINLSLTELISDVSDVLGSSVEAAIRDAHAAGAVVVAASGNSGRGSTPYGQGLPLLIVGASGRADEVWAQSNRDARTLFAPGVGIVSTHGTDSYARADGTSFAAPIVAAGAAILRARGLGNEAIRERLVRTAVPMGTGVGRVDVGAAAATVGSRASASTATPAPSQTTASEPASPTEAPGEPHAPEPGSTPVARGPSGDPQDGAEPPPEPHDEAPSEPSAEPDAGSDVGGDAEEPSDTRDGTDLDEPRAGEREQLAASEARGALEGWPVGLAAMLLLASAAGHAAVLSDRPRRA